MNTTINISLPKEMYNEAKKLMTDAHYSSVSEIMRDALRRLLQQKRITENGFTEEFEDAVLRSEAQPEEDDYVLETEADIKNYFLYHKLPLKRNDTKD